MMYAISQICSKGLHDIRIVLKKAYLRNSCLFYLLGILAVVLLGYPLTEAVFHEDDFDISYSGIVSGTFTGRASFSPCARTLQLPLHAKINHGSLLLPVGAKPGSYFFSKTDQENDSFKITFVIYDDERDEYYDLSADTATTGTLELEAIALDPGQEVRGNFQAKFRVGAEEFILTGKFDFQATREVSYDCLENRSDLY